MDEPKFNDPKPRPGQVWRFLGETVRIISVKSRQKEWVALAMTIRDDDDETPAKTYEFKQRHMLKGLALPIKK